MYPIPPKKRKPPGSPGQIILLHNLVFYSYCENKAVKNAQAQPSCNGNSRLLTIEADLKCSCRDQLSFNCVGDKEQHEAGIHLK